MMRVAIADAGYASYEVERRVAASVGADLEVRQCATEDEVVALAADADGLIVRMQPVTPRVLDGLLRCRVIARYGTGYDTVDVAAATERGLTMAEVRDPDRWIARIRRNG